MTPSLNALDGQADQMDSRRGAEWVTRIVIFRAPPKARDRPADSQT